VNTVAPGAIATPFHARTPPERLEAMRNAAPLGRIGEAQDCVGAFLFLASASYRATSRARSFTSTAACTCHERRRVHRRDWGTSNLRLRLYAGRRPRARFPRGTRRRRFAWSLRRDLRWAHRRLARARRAAGNAVRHGGSTFGWLEAPYLLCPEAIDSVAGSLARARPDVHIVPGMRCANPLGAPDVMRGEETQLLGALALHPALAQGRHLVCMPGTHTKWVALARRNGARLPHRAHGRDLPPAVRSQRPGPRPRHENLAPGAGFRARAGRGRQTRRACRCCTGCFRAAACRLDQPTRAGRRGFVDLGTVDRHRLRGRAAAVREHEGPVYIIGRRRRSRSCTPRH